MRNQRMIYDSEITKSYVRRNPQSKELNNYEVRKLAHDEAVRSNLLYEDDKYYSFGYMNAVRILESDRYSEAKKRQLITKEKKRLTTKSINVDGELDFDGYYQDKLDLEALQGFERAEKDYEYYKRFSKSKVAKTVKTTKSVTNKKRAYSDSEKHVYYKARVNNKKLKPSERGWARLRLNQLSK